MTAELLAIAEDGVGRRVPLDAEPERLAPADTRPLVAVLVVEPDDTVIIATAGGDSVRVVMAHVRSGEPLLDVEPGDWVATATAMPRSLFEAR